MSEVCAIMKVKPWINRSNPKPAPEKIHEVILPPRAKGETNAVYLGRVKELVLDKVGELEGVRIRATPSLVAQGEDIEATFVAYVEPKVDPPKRMPASRSGIAATAKR